MSNLGRPRLEIVSEPDPVDLSNSAIADAFTEMDELWLLMRAYGLAVLHNRDLGLKNDVADENLAKRAKELILKAEQRLAEQEIRRVEERDDS